MHGPVAWKTRGETKRPYDFWTDVARSWMRTVRSFWRFVDFEYEESGDWRRKTFQRFETF
jgi:hypothetical protein